MFQTVVDRQHVRADADVLDAHARRVSQGGRVIVAKGHTILGLLVLKEKVEFSESLQQLLLGVAAWVLLAIASLHVSQQVDSGSAHLLERPGVVLRQDIIGRIMFDFEPLGYKYGGHTNHQVGIECEHAFDWPESSHTPWHTCQRLQGLWRVAKCYAPSRAGAGVCFGLPGEPCLTYAAAEDDSDKFSSRGVLGLFSMRAMPDSVS